METITYYNLSQNTNGRLVYFRSTDVEQKLWKRLLWSVPDEMLYHIANEKQIKIIDKTSNIRGGKIKRIFIPVLNDLLAHLYFSSKITNTHLLNHLSLALDNIMMDKLLETKFMYWKKNIKILIPIIGEDIIIDKEPNPLR